jgi:arylsulfatase A-like enzyme
MITKVYGMVTNIDDNLGRLFARLDELKVTNDTIVVFLTDNGPQQPRYNSGMLQRKGNVHEGGIRVPCFIRWPGQLEAGRKVDRIAAHIDLAPTLLDACGVAKPTDVTFDGVSLLPLLKGSTAAWPDRTLYVQWHRGDEPELYRAFAARSQQYKLVQPVGAGAAKMPDKAAFKLYDMAKDPLEQQDIADKHPDLVAKMRKGYEDWFKDVGSTRGYAPPRIHLGAPQENPTLLTRQDWRGPRAGWGPNDLGHWEVQVTREGRYPVKLWFSPAKMDGTAHFTCGIITVRMKIFAGEKECTFPPVALPVGKGNLQAWIEQGKEKIGATYVEVKRKD